MEPFTIYSLYVCFCISKNNIIRFKDSPENFCQTSYQVWQNHKLVQYYTTLYNLLIEVL